MKPDQYVSSLNILFRVYPKNLPNINYDYLNDLIDHYSSKKNLNSSQSQEAETKIEVNSMPLGNYFFSLGQVQ